MTTFASDYGFTDSTANYCRDCRATTIPCRCKPAGRKLTLAQAKAIVKPLGFTLTSRPYYSEYRLNFVGGNEASASYPTTLDDAVATARMEHARKVARASEPVAKPAVAAAALTWRAYDGHAVIAGPLFAHDLHEACERLNAACAGHVIRFEQVQCVQNGEWVWAV